MSIRRNNNKNNTMTQVTGILYLGEGLLNLRNAKFELTPLAVGRVILRRKMKEESFPFNPKGRTNWLQSEVDFYNEINEGEIEKIENVTQHIDYIVDCLLHNNAPHIIGANRTQVSSAYVNEVSDALVSMLEDENSSLTA